MDRRNKLWVGRRLRTTACSASHQERPSQGRAVPVHQVTLSAFCLAKYETTYGLWYSVRQWATNNGYRFENAGNEGSQHYAPGAAPTENASMPVVRVNWRDCIVWPPPNEAGRHAVHGRHRASESSVTGCPHADGGRSAPKTGAAVGGNSSPTRIQFSLYGAVGTTKTRRSRSKTLEINRIGISESATPALEW
jgi:hypothetical protein